MEDVSQGPINGTYVEINVTPMRKKTLSRITLLALIVIISGVFLTMIHQFLMAIFMAALFSAIVKPLHIKLTARLNGRDNIASILTVFAIIALVLSPLSILITVVITQSNYHWPVCYPLGAVFYPGTNCR